MGDPALSLEQLLENSYADFVACARLNSIKHSQRKFHPNFVIKKESGAYMTSKGWNSKLLLHWLGDCSRRAFEKDLNVPGRVFGSWLLEQGRPPPETEILPLQALAVCLVLCLWVLLSFL